MTSGRTLSLQVHFALAFACACFAALLFAGEARAQDFFVDDSTPDGLVLYYKFDEPSSTTARPYVGPVNGTLENGASMGFGPVPPLGFNSLGVLALDGTNDRVSVPDNAALNTLNTNFTVSAWVDRDAIGAYHAIYDSGEQTNEWWVFISGATAGGANDNRLGFGERGVAEVYSTVVITGTDTAAEYHHIAVVKNGDSGQNILFYVDGVAAGTGSAGSVTTPSGAKHIGGLQDGSAAAHFDGRIDDFRLYNRALSAAEVLRLAQGKGCVSDGLTWGTAFRDIQCAITAASSGDDIWIGAGTYKPGTSRFEPYRLKNGVDLFGGFVGTETLFSQRPAFDPNAPLTILSGDIAGNDPATPFGAAGLYTDNTNTMVIADSAVVARVDGMRVQGGNANLTNEGGMGGGMRIKNGASITLSNVSFFGNQAAVQGGAITALSSALTISRTQFLSNTATTRGGGIFTSGPLTLVEGTLSRNKAPLGDGGAVYATAKVTVTESTFLTNTADGNGGAIEISATVASRVTGSTFTGNRARAFKGGAITTNAPLTLVSSDFTGNQAGFFGGAVNAEGSLSSESTNYIGNVALIFGGGAIAVSGPLRVQGGIFQRNRATFYGGAIDTNAAATIDAAQFISNTVTGANCVPLCTEGSGGAIISTQALTLTTSTLTGNVARLDGGAIASSGSLVVQNSTVQGNTAGLPQNSGNTGRGLGGGILAQEPPITLNNVNLVANRAAFDGGGLMISTPLDNTLLATISISESLFERNQAVAGFGGGMEAVEVTQITASNFLSNTASVGGGGASFRVPTLLAASEPVQSALSDGVVVEEVAPSGFIAVPRFEVSGSSFTGNVVGTGSGGGLLTNLPTQVTGSAFTGNTAQVDGGGIQATNLLTVTGSQFNGNRAVTRDGGGINSTAPSANSPATLSSGNLFQSNRTGRLGGGARFSGNSSGDQFLDNVSASEAGGLMSTSNLTITRGIFLRNRSNLSGALAVDLPNTRGTLRVTNSLFARNIYTTGTGAADMRLFDLNATLLHNTFADGVTVAGVGSLILFRTDLDARNNIFANYNVSVTPGQTATAVLDTNVLFNAPAAVSPAITNTNPITGDPAFANAAANDYHIGFASSARNAGLNVGVTSDFDGQPRPIGPKPDVGFDEAIFVPPTAAPGGPYNGVEGAPVALNGSGSTDDGTITTWAWDCTDNGTLDVTSSSPTGSTCTYPDNGSFALRLRVTDATGESGEATASVTIANGTPVVTPAAAQSAQVGAAKSVALGSFTDPGPDAPWAVTVNWGDGSTDTAFSANAVGALAAQSHTWATAGNFTVTVNVRDKDNATGTATFAVGVAAAPPGPNDDDFFLYLPTIQR